jgi:hypothetical protein
VRPVEKNADQLIVRFGIRLIQVLDVVTQIYDKTSIITLLSSFIMNKGRKESTFFDKCLAYSRNLL